ncbi:hypothetical protein [Streptomyces sp. NBC_00829]|uniref:hypothetical protein n=1 Tax=Streptomyces sp. NBC_00829 TaxID=2903679 RepID=UPI0038665648|nr:hypothetical protein OG293_12760 [Streptomyces sp. NBC_00829]
MSCTGGGAGGSYGRGRPPELWRGTGAPAYLADVYAAACLPHLCLTGQLPFSVPQLFSVMARHTTAPVPLAGVAEPLRVPSASVLTKGHGAALAAPSRRKVPYAKELG